MKISSICHRNKAPGIAPKDIKKNAKFIKITKAGFYESMVHSVKMIESTPNYKL